MVYYDVIAFLPLYVIIEYTTKNTIYSRLFFNILVSGYSVYEIVDKNYFTLDALNNIEEYNLVAEKCILISMLYFVYDLFDKETYTNTGFIIHHIIGLFGGLTVLYYKFYGILALYLCTHEVSNIFLNLKYLNICKDFSDKMFVLTFLTIRCTSLPIILIKTYLKSNILFIIILTDCGLHLFWIGEKIYNIRKKRVSFLNNNEINKLNLIEYGEKND